MKFFNFQFITLIATSTILAVPVTIDNDSCELALSEYDECFYTSDINLLNIDSVCSTFHSEKCQNFYSNGFIKGLESCQSQNPKLFKVTDNVYNPIYNRLKFKCTNDENGNYCPMNKLELDLRTMINVNLYTLYNEAAEETCKSKACTDAYIQYLNYTNTIDDHILEKITTKTENTLSELKNKISELEDKVQEFENNILDNVKKGLSKRSDSETTGIIGIHTIVDKKLDYFMSEQCTSQHQGQSHGQSTSQTTNGNVQSSDASTLSFKSIVLVAIVLISTLF